VGEITAPTFADSHITVLDVDPGVGDPRFIVYALMARGFPRIAEEALSVGATKQVELNVETLRRFRVPAPTREQQVAIADYLDAEIERSDAFVAARGRQRRLVIERARAWADAVVSAAGSRVRVARAIASVEQGASPRCENRPAGTGEVGVLKLSAVGPYGFAASENKRLAGGSPDRGLAVDTGDLLVTRANTPSLVGLAAVASVEPAAPRLLLPDLIYRLTLHKGYDPDYLQIALSTSDARAQISAAARGSSQTMVKLRGDDLRNLRVPLPPVAQQQEIARHVCNRRTATDLAITAIDSQISLLRERRQALITAAVTGRLQVPDASVENAAA